MSKEYNTLEYDKIVDLIPKDPWQAKEKLEVYLRNYPKDDYAFIHYLGILITLLELEKAKAVFLKVERRLNALESEITRNRKTYSEGTQKLKNDKLKKLRERFISNKIRLLIALNDYKSLEKLLLLSPQNINYTGDVVLFVQKQIGDLDEKINCDNISYIGRQIIDYNLEDALNEIIKIHPKYSSDYIVGGTLFDAEFPIDAIVSELPKYIPSDNKIFPWECVDAYYFKFDNCGKVNHKSTDYFVVYYLAHTDHILSIVPTTQVSNPKIVDLNYLNHNNKKPPSRVEAFYKRYPGLK